MSNHAYCGKIGWIFIDHITWYYYKIIRYFVIMVLLLVSPYWKIHCWCQIFISYFLQAIMSFLVTFNLWKNYSFKEVLWIQIICSHLCGFNYICLQLQVLNRSIWPNDDTLTGTIILYQSGHRSNGNEELTLHSSKL